MYVIISKLILFFSLIWLLFISFLFIKKSILNNHAVALKLILSPLVISSFLMTGFFFVCSNEIYGAAETYYTTKEVYFYDNTKDLNVIGCIREGEDITINSDISDNKYVEIEYAGEKGFIETEFLTKEEFQVVSKKEDGATAYSYAWKEPEYLLPESHFLSSVDETCEYAILLYASTPSIFDDYIVVEDYKNIILSEQILNSAYNNGSEYLTFVITNKNTGKWHISMSVKTYETSGDKNIDFGFRIKDNEIHFNERSFDTDIVIGIHNNFNVKAVQNGKALTPYTETYSSYFLLGNAEPVSFKGVALLDGLKDKNPLSDKEDYSDLSGFGTDENGAGTKNYVVYIYIFICICILGVATKIYMEILRNKKKQLRKRRK